MFCSTSRQTSEHVAQALQWIISNKIQVEDLFHGLDDFILFGPAHATPCHRGFSPSCLLIIFFKLR